MKIFSVLLMFFLFVGDVFAAKGYSSGSGRSYSKPAVKPVAPKGYSSGGGYSQKPSGSFQKMPAAEQKKVEARISYQKATAPKKEYVSPKGETVQIKPDDKRVTQIRNLDQDKWVNRQSREAEFYSRYQNYNGPVVHYNDPYNTFFWLWMLDRGIDEQARWTYHHQKEMDEQRYKDLLKRNDRLAAEIKKLEEQGVVRDPTYCPEGMDPDLQYTDEYVNAAYNPTVNWSSFWKFLLGCLGLVLIVFLIWFLFFFDWR